MPWSEHACNRLRIAFLDRVEGNRLGTDRSRTLGVMGAIMSVDRKIVEVGRAFRLSGPALVRRILLPAVLPAYIVALRSGLGLGWMFVVAAELLGASEGLGFLLIDGQQLGKPAQIVAAIVTFAIIGKTTDWIIATASAPFLRWEDRFSARAEGG
jgi:sulfonate transport system permease protein